MTPNLSAFPSLHQHTADNEANCIRLIYCAEKQFPCFLQKLNKYFLPWISLALLLMNCLWSSCNLLIYLFIWYYLGISSVSNSQLTDLLGMANVCKFILCCLVQSCGVPRLDDLYSQLTESEMQISQPRILFHIGFPSLSEQSGLKFMSCKWSYEQHISTEVLPPDRCESRVKQPSVSYEYSWKVFEFLQLC